MVAKIAAFQEGRCGVSTPTVRLPESRRGRRSASQQAVFDGQIAAFTEAMLEIRSNWISAWEAVAGATCAKPRA